MHTSDESRHDIAEILLKVALNTATSSGESRLLSFSSEGTASDEMHVISHLH